MKPFRSKFFNPTSYNWQKLSLELIVVFLGVTAGFLLNNWRLEEKEVQLEQKYISGFLQDINNNINELETSIQNDSIWLSRATPLLHTAKDSNIHIDTAKVIMGLVVQISKLNSNRGTYLDITNSGNLNILSDFVLKATVVDYYLSMEGVEFIDNYVYKYFSDFVMPFTFKEFNVLRGEFNDPEIVNKIQFMNLFAGYYSMVQQRKASYNDLLIKSYSLRDLLERN